MIIGIFGTGRNGSTLLSRLLDGIPGTYVHPVEINFLSAMNDLASKGHVSGKTAVNADTTPLKSLRNPIQTSMLVSTYKHQVQEIENTYISQVEDISLGENPLETLRSRPEYYPEDLVKAFLPALSKWINRNIPLRNSCFKTIETPYVEDYERLFPDMKFIHIVRNPLDVYSSAKRGLMHRKKRPMWYLGGDLLSTFIIKRWLPHVRFIIAKTKSDKHFLVRYEDLVKDPLYVIKNICDWLNLPLPEHPDRQTILCGRFAKELPLNLSKKGVKTPVEVVSNLAQKHNYEQVISNSEQLLIIHLTYFFGKQLGYFEDLKRPGRSEVIKAWLIPGKWEFMHSNSLGELARSFFSVFHKRVTYLKNVL